MSVELVTWVLERNVGACASASHDPCGGTQACASALAFHRSQHCDPRASEFDARRALLDQGTAWPDETWPTVALLRLVKDRVGEPPTRDPLRRTLQTTMALARLAERGLPANAVLRTALSRYLVRRVVIHVATHWVLARDGQAGRGEGALLEPWLGLLDAELIAQAGEVSVADTIITALHGRVGEGVRRWVREASVAHLLGWRFEDYLPADVVEDELTITGGETATVWIIDRFTETYLDEWRGSSLQWELLYRRRPDAIGARVGLPESMLAERLVSEADLLDAMDRRLTGKVGDDLVADGLRASEVIELVVGLVRDGELDQALDLARRSARVAPDNPWLVVAHAFCLIPTDPRRASEMLDRLGDVPPDVASAVAVDRATISLLIEGRGVAEERCVRAAVAPGPGGWFWDPEEALAGRFVVRSYAPGAWGEHVRALLTAPDSGGVSGSPSSGEPGASAPAVTR